MFLHYLYRQTGLNHFHSTDLADMRRALLDEDQDGPDGGSADVTGRLAPSGRWETGRTGQTPDQPLPRRRGRPRSAASVTPVPPRTPARSPAGPC